MYEALVRLFAAHHGRPPRSILEIAGDGSNRSYYRLIADDLRTAVGAIGPDHEENRTFISFTRAFHAAGLPVPELYGADEPVGVWLEEDLGDTTLFNALVEARKQEPGVAFPDAMLPVYRRVVEALPRFQVEGGRVVDYSVAYPRAAFDMQSILWDLNYFKYHFLKLAHVPFNEQRLENDFDALARFLLRADTNHFLYRDFQSRNIMLVEGEPYFIDYQGGRRGAPQYDIASLLYDAKAAIPEDVRRHLLDHYLDALAGHISFDRHEFLELYRGYVLVRIMQALGAYGYRGFFERKPRFLQSVPFAARNLRRLLAAGLPVELPELEAVFQRIVAQWAHRGEDVDPGPGLTVRLRSFSFKRGYPDDDGGHGGGFVFDCRALPNPGRHLEYRTLCGRDAGVVEYLERSADAHQYWTHVRSLVDAQIEEYLRRSFGSLTVAFGCTGGQHRSVYFAERLAAHIRHEFPQVNVQLAHREEQSWPRADVALSLPPIEEPALADAALADDALRRQRDAPDERSERSERSEHRERDERNARSTAGSAGAAGARGATGAGNAGSAAGSQAGRAAGSEAGSAAGSEAGRAAGSEAGRGSSTH
jgi:aminoglycoside/choline kinase family phosphotransferase